MHVKCTAGDKQMLVTRKQNTQVQAFSQRYGCIRGRRGPGQVGTGGAGGGPWGRGPGQLKASGAGDRRGHGGLQPWDQRPKAEEGNRRGWAGGPWGLGARAGLLGDLETGGRRETQPCGLGQEGV